jgi:hypothetical protein
VLKIRTAQVFPALRRPRVRSRGAFQSLSLAFGHFTRALRTSSGGTSSI